VTDARAPEDSVAFVYSPELSSWALSPDHPFKPIRLELVKDLLHSTGLLAADEVHPPRPLRPGDLARVHDQEYLQMVERVSRGESADEAFHFGLGTSDTPIFRGMHEAISLVCAASATAVDLVLDGQVRRAASFAGGLHHAMPAHASGFCVYDDLAIAILRATDRGLRVAYLDLDAHHGDGVQHAFYESDQVLTISLHESGRYLFPGTGHSYELGAGAGRGWSVNIPLEPFTEDDSYLATFDEVVPRALRAFSPDLIVLQAGADAHRADPLADLALTVAGMRGAYDRVAALADELCDGRLVITGGGGYAAYDVVPRAWAQAWAAMTGRTLPESLPKAWRERWGARLAVRLPTSPVDEPDDRPQPHRLRIQNHNMAVARRLLQVLEPIWREARTPTGRDRAPRKEETT